MTPVPATTGAEAAFVPVHPDILTDDNPTLRTVSTPVEYFDDYLAALVNRMLVILRGRGVGLAAIQIGVPARVIVTIVDGDELVMINPVIVRRLRRDDVMREGCLSVPPMKWKPLARPAKCDVEWQDLMGKAHKGTFSNLAARAIMHEVDHLDGVLITDLPRPASNGGFRNRKER